MKRAPIKIFQIITILIALGVSFIPHVSDAAGWLEEPAVSVVNTALSIVANWILGLTSTLVTVAGVFLSISINLTTHIGDFYNSIPALNDVWVVVRNISSMFIIFALLYTSISTILGVGKGVKEIIGKIIIVGLLINFSLFFCKILIDASNLVSLQFYRAIAPQYQVDGLSKVSSAYYDGGLSNVFMNSLKIPKIYQNQNILKSADVTLSISFATVGGVIMMITAAISFFAAAIAFTIRTGLLLFVMALSPLYFAAMIFPQAKEKADELMKLFKNQLIFMPAYLFLMYIALRLISSPGFSAIFNQNATGVAAPNEGAFGPTFVGIIIQYVIALFFINAPLLMAIKMGASGAGWAPDMNKVAGVFGRNTLGRLGKSAGGRFDSMAANAQGTALGRGASSVLRNIGLSQAVRSGLNTVEKSKYGGTQNLEDVKKEDKERARVISGVQRTKTQTAAINAFVQAHKSGVPTTTQIDNLRKQVGSMDVKELEKVDKGTLLDSNFASYIPTSKYEALLKSDELTPQQQQDLRAAREKGMTDILSSQGADYLINTHLKGKPQDIAKLPSSVITDPGVSILMDPAMLRKMVDENISRSDRQKIRDTFNTHLGTTGSTITPAFQRAYDYLNGPAGQIF